MTSLECAREKGWIGLLIRDALYRLTAADSGLAADPPRLAAALRAEGFTPGEVEAALFLSPEAGAAA